MRRKDESLTETFRSTIDIDVYIDKQDNKPYIQLLGRSCFYRTKNYKMEY
ncbi:hypothetical protein KBH77_02660 [Patescibacteria group bacterium]|nr:hypothetical protein [Patescibacteria group bacterium]